MKAARVVAGWMLLGLVGGSVLGWASVPYPETTPEQWRGYGAQSGLTVAQRELRLLSNQFVRYQLLLGQMMLGGAVYGAGAGVLVGVAGRLIFSRQSN